VNYDTDIQSPENIVCFGKGGADRARPGKKRGEPCRTKKRVISS
jgi:hypothetical protein